MTDIAKEYGTALFMLACEENEKNGYGEALEAVKDTFAKYPQYTELLASPGIPLGERLEIIDRTFSGVVAEHVLSYLKLLCEKGRIQYFSETVEHYKALLDASERILNVKITSAVELTEAEKQKLVNKLELIEKSKVHAEYSVDATLLGGLIVEVDGKIMDGSLRHRLHDVKEVINT